jgi:hypothetical protein
MVTIIHPDFSTYLFNNYTLNHVEITSRENAAENLLKASCPTGRDIATYPYFPRG